MSKKIKKIIITALSFIICIVYFLEIDVEKTTYIKTYAITQEQETFINNVGNAAQKNYAKYKILPSMTTAQAILESNWGKSSLSKLYYNFFGMKAGSNYNGETVTLKTGEEINGIKITVNGTFRVYHSFDEGIEGYYKFITGMSRYTNLIGETNYKTACKKIKDDGWATDSSYSSKLINLIETYNLTKFDKSLPTYTLQVTPGTTGNKTTFNWNPVEAADHYDLKVWKGTYWDGEPYYSSWNEKGTSQNVSLPPGHYEGYVDTIKNDNSCHMSNVVIFDVEMGNCLKVDSGSTAEKTKFTWTSVSTADHYDLKVWKGTYWDGDPYYSSWNEKSTSHNVSLPPGHYEGYVDIIDYKDSIYMSNVVTFDVEMGNCLKVDSGSTADKTKFNWTSISTADHYDLKLWKGTYWDGDPYYSSWNESGTSHSVSLPPGHYEGYVDIIDYKDSLYMSNVVAFDVEMGNCLKVNSGSTADKTKFTWASVSTADHYDLKLWKGTYWDGEPYYSSWNEKGTSHNVSLPPGHYEGYVDITDYKDSLYMSNVIAFDVEMGNLLKVSAGNATDKTKFTWTSVSTADHYDLKLWKGTYWDGEPYYSSWNEKDTSHSVSLPPGHYEGYVDITDYKDSFYMSNVVVFDIKACNHAYGSWSITKAATCTSDGIKTRKCSICGNVETATISKTGHKYETKVIAPTNTEQGYSLHTCSICGNSYKDNYIDSIPLTTTVTTKPISTITTTTAIQLEITCDLNTDGKINVSDIVLFQQYLVNKSTILINVDLNGDGKINVFDLIILKRKILNAK